MDPTYSEPTAGLLVFHLLTSKDASRAGAPGLTTRSKDAASLLRSDRTLLGCDRGGDRPTQCWSTETVRWTSKGSGCQNHEVTRIVQGFTGGMVGSIEVIDTRGGPLWAELNPAQPGLEPPVERASCKEDSGYGEQKNTPVALWNKNNTCGSSWIFMHSWRG